MCCVVVCDLETSRMGAPYIYDISHLRVKGGRLQYLRGFVFLGKVTAVLMPVFSFAKLGAHQPCTQ